MKQSLPTTLFGIPADGEEASAEHDSADDIGAWALEALEDQHPVLRRGDDRPAVERLQERLTELGYALKVDGNFGPVTDRAVRRFQRDRGLAGDGIVGHNTWVALS